ncbi:unnamed protein product [Microthlaspi erraticum]|uniref:CCHC-type domain-containing protein n=1 Tax=Microthlaspi erraticum TaxID=1685480 RepID=A0A6D2HUF4_9BRAS|nr:unnamed protein product [Microthlaspi erraticum]
MVAIEEKCDSSDSESVEDRNEDSSEAEANLIGMSSESEEEDDSMIDVESEFRKLYDNLVATCGTKDLDKILSMGRVGKSNFGLGYSGGETTGKTKFVNRSSSITQSEKPWCPGHSRHNQRSEFVRSCNMSCGVPTRRVDHMKFKERMKCYYCGRQGHIKRYCYQFADKVNGMLKQGRYFQYQDRKSQVWMVKSEL